METVRGVYNFRERERDNIFDLIYFSYSHTHTHHLFCLESNEKFKH